MDAVADDARSRRLRRLHEELIDERVPIDLAGPVGEALLEELDYARRPHTHEGMSPRFGALIVPPGRLQSGALGFPARVEPTDGTSLDAVRLLADGRSTFVARGDGSDALVCFDRTIEHESTAVQVAAGAGITLVQRLPSGWVRIFAPHAVVAWDGARWWTKPLAADLVTAVGAVRPQLHSPVLAGLAEFCVHWLSAARVGALVVWQLDDAPLGHLGVGAEVAIPPLEMTCREHYPAALNILAQSDRAAIVAPDGRLRRIGVALRQGEEAQSAIGPYRGTRHTSARRFSYSEPSALVFAVSSSGPVTVLHGGEIISVTARMPAERP